MGAGGPVSNELAGILSKKDEPVTLASRRQQPASGNTRWVKTDLLNYDEVLAASKGASVIYMCAGLKYDTKVWTEEWPKIADNLVQAARETGARLIFFDNVYMYGHVNGPMTEKTPYQPSSAKGQIRAQVADKLMNEAAAGHIKASIGRAADFYGAKSMNSVLDSMILSKFSKKSGGMWLGNVHTRHAFTYVPDAAKGMAILGEHPESDNQVWHLPTAPALTGKEYIDLAASVFGSKPSYMRVSKLMLQLMGLFSKPIKESVELYYQYQYDYLFDSSRFEKAFQVKPVSYEEGFRQLAAASW